MKGKISAYCDEQPSTSHNHESCTQGPGTHLWREEERKTRGVRVKEISCWYCNGETTQFTKEPYCIQYVALHNHTTWSFFFAWSLKVHNPRFGALGFSLHGPRRVSRQIEAQSSQCKLQKGLSHPTVRAPRWRWWPERCYLFEPSPESMDQYAPVSWKQGRSSYKKNTVRDYVL